jgi:hypothetical protein
MPGFTSRLSISTGVTPIVSEGSCALNADGFIKAKKTRAAIGLKKRCILGRTGIQDGFMMGNKNNNKDL